MNEALNLINTGMQQLPALKDAFLGTAQGIDWHEITQTAYNLVPIALLTALAGSFVAGFRAESHNDKIVDQSKQQVLIFQAAKGLAVGAATGVAVQLGALLLINH